MGQYTRLTVVQGIAQIVLNRPASYNALDLPMARALSDTLLQVSSDGAVEGVIITGAGKAFSSGGDLKRVLEHRQGPAAAFHDLVAYVHLGVSEIRRMRKPVVAAINGVAAGGGFSLALACDFRVLAESARLVQAFTSSGLSIDAGGTFTLPRLVGLARALEIATFDQPISSEQALQWGLVTKVVQDEEVLDQSMEMALAIASKSLHAFGWTKQLLTSSFETPFETQLERERLGLESCASHADGIEGLRAFVDKRKPVFKR